MEKNEFVSYLEKKPSNFFSLTESLMKIPQGEKAYHEVFDL